MERSILISNEDLDILVEALDALEKKANANAERTKSGYGKVKSEIKRENFLSKADSIRELCTRISYEFI